MPGILRHCPLTDYIQGEVNKAKVPEGAGVFSYRGDDDHGRMTYDGDWKNKAAHGYGVMKWQNGDRSEVISHA